MNRPKDRLQIELEKIENEKMLNVQRYQIEQELIITWNLKQQKYIIKQLAVLFKIKCQASMLHH